VEFIIARPGLAGLVLAGLALDGVGLFWDSGKLRANVEMSLDAIDSDSECR
jgi:hypothetical protein